MITVIVVAIPSHRHLLSKLFLIVVRTNKFPTFFNVNLKGIENTVSEILELEYSRKDVFQSSVSEYRKEHFLSMEKPGSPRPPPPTLPESEI